MRGHLNVKICVVKVTLPTTAIVVNKVNTNFRITTIIFVTRLVMVASITYVTLFTLVTRLNVCYTSLCESARSVLAPDISPILFTPPI
jgi:hypothetical protein